MKQMKSKRIACVHIMCSKSENSLQISIGENMTVKIEHEFESILHIQ